MIYILINSQFKGTFFEDFLFAVVIFSHVQFRGKSIPSIRNLCVLHDTLYSI